MWQKLHTNVNCLQVTFQILIGKCLFLREIPKELFCGERGFHSLPSKQHSYLCCGVDVGSEPYFAKDKANSLAEHLLDKSSIP